jgi:diguanylate cyclase (GGDEF)-like protein
VQNKLFRTSIGSLSFQRNPLNWLTVGGIVLIASIVIGTAFAVVNFRQRALENSERELENTVLLLARHFDRELNNFETVQKQLVRRIELTGVASPDAFRRQLSGVETHEALQAEVSRGLDLSVINVFDADGELINSSMLWPISAISIADRSFFRDFSSDPSSPAVLVVPVQSRFMGGWTTIVARKVVGPNGRFLGVVTRGISPANFESFFESLALGQGAAISVLHRDGTLLARHPHIEEMIGRNIKTAPVQKALDKAEQGTIRVISPVDGEERLASTRHLSEFPLSIVATTTVAAALADWRTQTRVLIVAATLAAIVIAFMLFVVVRQLSTQHKRAELRLAVEKRRLNTAVNNMTQGLLLYDSSARIIVCNDRYIEMYGLSPDVVKPGCSFRDVVAHRKQTGSFKGDVDEFCSTVLRNVSLGRLTSTIVETTDGRAIQIVNKPLAEGGWVATQEDITERRRAEERITHLAHYDALTDLPNRVLFHEKLEQALKRVERGEQLAVLYIDIDEFKSVNDTLGHSIGDELLKGVAGRLRECLRETDLVARLGGDEFAIIQTALVRYEDTTELVARIYEAIRAPYECGDHLLTTDASIGIALAPQDGTDLDQLLKNADLAMYGAKADGRRTYRFFEPGMDARVKALRALELDLRQAVSDGSFEIYYQPVIDIRDNKVSGCEALLRWRHPKLGMISPADFIPVAEETGLINQLGEWVLTTACAEAATWPDHIKVAVNVSPVQFRSQSLALKVAAALAASGLRATRLELEITEAVLIRDDEAALAMLHQIRKLGVRIALDDFGTGYSSLSYLQRFPFDKIKIDRSFIKAIAEPTGSASIVRAVVNIAESRRMTTTAEGVETEQQLEILRDLGCTEMQGYLYSPALPAAELAEKFLSSCSKASAVA